MKRISCIVQKHMFSHADIRKLEKGLRAIYKENYSDEKVNVIWMVMPKGSAYSERKPSEATIILVEVDDDIEQTKREELMSLFSQYLFQNFKISPLDSIISVANSSYVQQFVAAQQNRVHPKSRKWIGLKTMGTALFSKFTNGYMKLRVKY